MTRRASTFLVVFAMLGGVLAIVTPVGVRLWRLLAYAQEQQIGAELMRSLNMRCPETVPNKTWSDATGWAMTAYGNVCFSEKHVPFDELVRFNQEAKAKLAGDVGLETIDWVWERLAKTGPHGQRYFDTFHPEYRSLVYDSQSKAH